MSIAFGRNNGNQIQRSKFMQGVSVYKSSAEPGFLIGSGQLEVEKQRKDNDGDGSSSSSSIGRNSDSSGGSSDGEDRDEVQSSCKGPLDTLDALEEVLPKKRGLSSFYNGKSKSFTSLGDASSAASVKDLAKPDDPYTRKRKNLLAQSINWDNNQNPLIQSKGIGILKGPANYRQSTVHSSNSDCFDSIPSSSQNLPPLHPQGKKSSGKGPPSLPPPRRNSPWRSFSLSDLQCIAADETTSLAGMAYHGG